VKKILCLLHKHQFGDINYPISVEYKLIYETLKKINKNTFFLDTNDEKYIYLNNVKILNYVKKIRPEVIFCHQSSYEIYSETFDIIRSICSPIIINWCSDDSWRYKQHSALIARSFDFLITTYQKAHNNNNNNNINSILSNWGCADNWFIKPRKNISYLYDVCFIGSAYMDRKKMIKNLKDLGIHVECFGKGWGNIIDDNEYPKIINRSKININFSKSRGNQLQTKARVFEITGAGGFCLSEKSNELKYFFKEHYEIATFNNLIDLKNKIHYYLLRSDERKNICNNSYLRCRKNYNYRKIIQNILNILKEYKHKKKTNTILYKDFKLLRKNNHWMLKFYKTVSEFLMQLLFSKQKARKISRRFLFEIEWRIRGEKTYSSYGWCSNLFNYH